MVFNSVLNCGLAPTFRAQKKEKQIYCVSNRQKTGRLFRPGLFFAKDGPWLKCVLSFACCPHYTLVFF